jgi:hypothetical protein
MLKIVLVSVLGFAVLGWFVSDPDALFDGATIPPTIRADSQPFKHRPNSYTAAQKSLRQAAQNVQPADVNLILAR